MTIKKSITDLRESIEQNESRWVLMAKARSIENAIASALVIENADKVALDTVKRLLRDIDIEPTDIRIDVVVEWCCIVLEELSKQGA